MINWLANGMILGEPLDVLKGFCMDGLPFEKNILLGETGDDGRSI
jgi:hypothetical protein